jgi:predicted HD phosphohydrolase
MIIAPVEAIDELLESAGARDYPGEPVTVTVTAHLLQASTLAETAGARRRWDGEAKDPDAVTPGFAHFRPLLEELLAA